MKSSQGREKQGREKEVKVARKSRTARTERKIIRRPASSSSSFSKSDQNAKPGFQLEKGVHRGIGDIFKEQLSKGTRFLGVAFNVANVKSQNKDT